MSPIVLLTAALLGVAHADAPRRVPLAFSPIGPEGGDVRSLARDPSDPSRVYAGTADGILYVSTDAGASWSRLEPGFPLRGASIDDIVVADDGTVDVGFWRLDDEGGGLYRSTDRGRTFERIGAGLEGEAVRGIARAPSDPTTFVAVTKTGVFRSADGGASFSRMSPAGHAALQIVGSVAIDPRNAARVYVGTARLAWTTGDGGRSWTPIQRGMINDSDVMTLNVDRRRASTLYATACTGIWRSRDAGGSWNKVLGIPQVSRRTRAFAQDPGRPDTFYAGTTDGIYVSTDDAATFRRNTAPGLIVNAIVALGGGRVIAGVEGDGLLASSDFGQTWSVSNAGFRERQFRLLAADAARDRIFAVSGAEGARSAALFARFGASGWRRLPLPGGREITAIEALSDGELALGTDDGLFLVDPATADSEAARRVSLRVLDADPRPRVVAIHEQDGRLAVGTTHGLFETVDRRNWVHARLGLARNVVAIGRGPQGAPVAATPLEIFDLASTEARRPLSAAPDRGLKSIGFLPGDPDTVFLGSSRGLLRSRDGGRTWISPEVYPMRRVTAIAFHPDGRRVFVADADIRTVYASDDRGETFWPIAASGLPSQRVFATLVLPGPSGARLILAASGGGLLEANVPAPDAPASSR